MSVFANILRQVMRSMMLIEYWIGLIDYNFELLIFIRQQKWWMCLLINSDKLWAGRPLCCWNTE